MRNPIDTLVDTRQSKLVYIVKAFVISVVPATAISYLLYQINPLNNSGSIDLPLFSALIQLVVLAPIIETFLMWPIISIIGRFTKNKLLLTALLSALIWALFHALFSLNWGLTILWPFFVFSIVFCVWKRQSLLWALIMTASVHALQNLSAVVYLNFA